MSEPPIVMLNDQPICLSDVGNTGWRSEHLRKLLLKCINGQEKWKDFLDDVINADTLNDILLQLKGYDATITNINEYGLEFWCETAEGYLMLKQTLDRGCCDFVFQLFYPSEFPSQCKFTVNEEYPMSLPSDIPKHHVKRQLSNESVESGVSGKTWDSGYGSTSDSSTHSSNVIYEDLSALKSSVAVILKTVLDISQRVEPIEKTMETLKSTVDQLLCRGSLNNPPGIEPSVVSRDERCATYDFTSNDSEATANNEGMFAQKKHGVLLNSPGFDTDSVVSLGEERMSFNQERTKERKRINRDRLYPPFAAYKAKRVRMPKKQMTQTVDTNFCGTCYVSEKQFLCTKMDPYNRTDDDESNHSLYVTVTNTEIDEVDDLKEKTIADMEQRHEQTNDDSMLPSGVDTDWHLLAENGTSSRSNTNKTHTDFITKKNEVQLEQLEREGVVSYNFTANDTEPNEMSEVSPEETDTNPAAKETPSEQVDCEVENYNNYSEILDISNMYQGQGDEPSHTVDDDNQTVCLSSTKVDLIGSQQLPETYVEDLESQYRKDEISLSTIASPASEDSHRHSSIPEKAIPNLSQEKEKQQFERDGLAPYNVTANDTEQTEVSDISPEETTANSIAMSTLKVPGNDGIERNSDYCEIMDISDRYQGDDQRQTADCNIYNPRPSSVQVGLLGSQQFSENGFKDVESCRLLSGANLPNSSVLGEIVSNLLREAECYPRWDGLDTMFLWDISGSICERTFKDSQAFMIYFVKYIEEMAAMHEIGENIGIVTIGEKTEILCHLTNDYTRLLEKIVSVETSNGTTPLTLGLLLCHIEVKKRGGPISDQPIHPRILVISDGRPTDDAGLFDQKLETSPDDPSVQERVLTFCRELRKQGYHISCVSVGPSANQPFLDKIASAEGGQVYHVENVADLYKYYIRKMIPSLPV